MKKAVPIILIAFIFFTSRLNAVIHNPFKKIMQIGKQYFTERQEKARDQKLKTVLEKEKKKCLSALNAEFPSALEHFSFAFTTYLEEILEPDIEGYLSKAGISSVSFDQHEEEEGEEKVMMPSARDLKDCRKKRMESLDKWYTKITQEEFDSLKGEELGGVHHMYRIIRYMIEDPENRFTRSMVMQLRETTRKKVK